MPAPFRFTRFTLFTLLCLLIAAGCGDSSGGDESGCEAVCDTIEGCFPNSGSCVEDCERDYEEALDFSQACADAVAELTRCVSRLSCEEIIDWEDENPPDDYPCRDEEIAIDEC